MAGALPLKTKLDLVKAAHVIAVSNQRPVPVKKMILDSISDLNDRHGSTLQAIKSKMVQKYIVDTQKISHHIKKFILSAVEKGLLLNTSDRTGLNGKFKLPAKKSKAVPSRKAGKLKVDKKPTKASQDSVQEKVDLKAKKAAPAKKTQGKKAEKENPTGTDAKLKKIASKKKPHASKLVDLDQLPADDHTREGAETPKKVQSVKPKKVDSANETSKVVKKTQMKKTAPQAKSSAPVLSEESEEETSSKNKPQASNPDVVGQHSTDDESSEPEVSKVTKKTDKKVQNSKVAEKRQKKKKPLALALSEESEEEEEKLAVPVKKTHKAV